MLIHHESLPCGVKRAKETAEHWHEVTCKGCNEHHAREKLRELLPPGSKVYTILRHVSRSGMSRRIDLYHFGGNAEQHGPSYLSGYVADALGYPRHYSGALVVGGCGMDVGFHLVHSLSYALHGWKDRKRPCDTCDDSSEVDTKWGKRQCPDCEIRLASNPEDDNYRAGYSLKHEWL